MIRQFPNATLLILSLALLPTGALSHAAETPARPDLVVTDFESEHYEGWQPEGEAFGPGPARGTLPGQMPVTAFHGQRLVNSFFRGDQSIGRLISPPIRLERPWINFLIGGGGYPGETCINLLVDGKVVRTATGPNTQPGGSEELQPVSWAVAEFHEQTAVLQIVDQRRGGWGHISVDHIVQSDRKAAPIFVALERQLTVNDSCLIVPVTNTTRQGNSVCLGIYAGKTLVQNFKIALPQQGDASWQVAYPLQPFALQGQEITVKPVDGRQLPEEYQPAFEQIMIGPPSAGLASSDYAEPYRNQFHASTRRGWNNDPNGMVYYNGVYHLYYQYNPFGISWGNMHWGHFESPDLVHWNERPIALVQNTVNDMAFSGSGFVDITNSAGLGEKTLFIAYTSTGRGECLAASHDGGLTFQELKENPVVKHQGRDPRVFWYEPERKWVMAVYNNEPCAETRAIAPAEGNENRANANITFWESKNLKQWTRTGAFTDADRNAVYECPELFELPVEETAGDTRWVLYGAQNRYFIGQFDGKTFHKESGPHGRSRAAFYAAQTFNHSPGGRRIQIGWVRTASYLDRFPNQMTSQSFSLPQELSLHRTAQGLRLFLTPVAEARNLRSDLLAEGQDLTPAAANELLQNCREELSEVLIEYSERGTHKLLINGLDASFEGASARILTDRTFNEIYAQHGEFYEVRRREPSAFDSHTTQIGRQEQGTIRRLQVFRLKSIWHVP